MIPATFLHGQLLFEVWYLFEEIWYMFVYFIYFFTLCCIVNVYIYIYIYIYICRFGTYIIDYSKSYADTACIFLKQLLLILQRA